MALEIRTYEGQGPALQRPAGVAPPPVAPATASEALARPDSLRVAPLPAAGFEPTVFSGIPLPQPPVLLAQEMPQIPLERPKAAAPKHDDFSKSFLDRLHRAADQAKAKFDNMKGKCFRTSDQIVRWLSGRGIADFDASESSKGQPLSHLNQLIDIGKLRPGMVIYVSRKPGADPMSIDMRYGPHWFTYLGKDDKGVPRFVDQYSTRETVDSLQQLVPGRKIYQIYDPFPKARSKT